MRTSRQLAALGFIAFLGLSLAAQSPSAGTSPADVVRQYCQFDMKGARLSSQNPYVDQITALATWPIEPGWDSATVVMDFEIIKTQAGQNTSSIEVRYGVLGQMTGASVIAARRHEQLVTFTLKKLGSSWKIDRPLIEPHVSVQAATSALRDLLAGETNPQRRERLDQGLATLSGWEHTKSAGVP